MLYNELIYGFIAIGLLMILYGVVLLVWARTRLRRKRQEHDDKEPN